MRRWVVLACVLTGCSSLGTSPGVDAGASDVDVDVDIDVATDLGGDAGEEAFTRAQVVFDFGDWTIPAGGEQYPCAVWTLNNEQPLYVNGVIQANDGGFHHSNWYAVGDDQYQGPDGFFDCRERNFQEAVGAVFGEVVFAQSTQAYVEDQRFPEGVVIKIPPNSKIIGGLHLLNVSSTPLDTGVRMGLELVHPADVETIATPWRMDNSSLRIPGGGVHSRWTADCNLKRQYENKTDETFAPLIYWVLPHYHALGDYFRVDLIKPDGDVTLVELAGFNAEANGVTFAEPVDLTDVTGMRLVCGYTNPYDRFVYYGTQGDDEMCTMLAFTNAAMRLNTEAREVQTVDQSEGFETFSSECFSLFLPKNEGQQLPTQEELDAPLYVPASNTDDGESALVPDCEDTPADASPAGAVTLSSIRADVFRAGCSYSACHDANAPAHGLDLTAPDLHNALLQHDLVTGASMPLVTPGDPDQSWLYRVMSTCEPEADTGAVSRMPRNAPRLLPPGEVARVRAWIEAGALDD